MKLLRVGKKGNEKPAILDKGGKIRDISSYVSDLNPDHLNFETISKLKNVDLEALPEISNSDRTGPCVSKPGKFVAIGLAINSSRNFSNSAISSSVISTPVCCFCWRRAPRSLSVPYSYFSFSSVTNASILM